LCLVPPLAASDFTDSHAWAGALTIALAFCLVASGIYLLNDISDLAADRSHPRKSRRPFASGDLPVAVGVTLSSALLLTGTLMGWIGGALAPLMAYLAGSLAYTMWLKEKPLVDVFILAALYTIRLFGGGEASGHPVSLWLLGFSSFLFLSLALIKRVSELQRLEAAGGERHPKRRGYVVEDAPLLQMFGSCATFASALVLSLYVQSDIASRAYSHPAMLWGSIPLLLFWQCRLWLATARGHMHDDPIIYAARDPVSWMVLACLVGVAGAACLPFTR
jgi:4-hydroxybenzoate polyprenyltransferase